MRFPAPQARPQRDEQRLTRLGLMERLLGDLHRPIPFFPQQYRNGTVCTCCTELLSTRLVRSQTRFRFAVAVVVALLLLLLALIIITKRVTNRPSITKKYGIPNHSVCKQRTIVGWFHGDFASRHCCSKITSAESGQNFLNKERAHTAPFPTRLCAAAARVWGQTLGIATVHHPRISQFPFPSLLRLL